MRSEIFSETSITSLFRGHQYVERTFHKKRKQDIIYETRKENLFVFVKVIWTTR